MTTTSETAGGQHETTLGHLDALHQLVEATVAATTVDAIHEAALDVLLDSLPANRAAIVGFGTEVDRRVTAWRGLSLAFRDALEDHRHWRPYATALVPTVVDDLTADAGLGGLTDAALAEGIRSVAFLPLSAGARLLGALAVFSDRPYAFDDHAVALSRTVAGHLTFAVERRRLEDELRRSSDKLNATLNAVSEGITVQAPDGSLLLANNAAAAMLGFPSVAALITAGPKEAVAAFELLDEHGAPLPLERLPSRAALGGEEPPETLVRWRMVATGTERITLVRSRPVRDDAGQVMFAVNVFRDVTERQLAVDALRTSEARLAFLALASRRLLTTSLREPFRVLEEVADLVVPELADFCVVREFTEDGGLARVGVGPRELHDTELLDRLERYGDLPCSHPALEALTAGRSILVSDITPETLRGAAEDEEHLDLLRQLRFRTLMLVPLRSHGRTVGVLTLAGRDRPSYTTSDLALAEELAIRVAGAVGNARSFATERATAKTLARALLPGHLPNIPGLQLAARYQAAGDVGGDFYDCFRTVAGTWLLVVGDVCGRGIHAASMTGLTRHTIRAAALHGRSPSAVLGDLNQLLLDAAEEGMHSWLSREQGAGPSFCTVCLAAVTPNEGGASVVISSAGHPLPFVVRQGGAVVEVGQPGSLLGVLPRLQVSEQTWQLGPGDALVLFTDGITERRQGGSLFEEQMEDTLRGLAGAPAAEMARALEATAVAFGTMAPGDDMAVLVVSVPAVPGGGMRR